MNRHQIAAAAVLWFVVPQIALWPFRGTLEAIFPEPTLWQAVGMLMGSTIIFALGVYALTLRQRARLGKIV